MYSEASFSFVVKLRAVIVVSSGVWPGGGFIWPCPKDTSVIKMLLD